MGNLKAERDAKLERVRAAHADGMTYGEAILSVRELIEVVQALSDLEAKREQVTPQ